MKKSASTSRPINAVPVHPDAPLILICIEYGRALRGASGAFEIDPTGNSDFAELADAKALRTARKASAATANYLPSTFDGLRAKANAALIGLDLDRDDVRDVLESLCKDIERFHKAIAASGVATAKEIAA